MLDYVIAVAVALIGLVVVYTMFTMIDSKEVVVTKVAKPAAPKKAAPAKATKAERKAQREEDEIIAKEVALATSGMHADKRKATITTLDEYRSNKKDKQEARKTASGPVQTAFSPKQVEQDKEQGFAVVKRVEVKKRETSPAEVEAISQKEALDRKLGQFFRASAKKGKGGKKDFLAKDEPTTEGGKVVIKGAIGGGRTW